MMLTACAACQRTFPEEDGRFCPADGSTLVPIDTVAVPTDPSDPIMGATIASRYHVRRKIADGGMGRVYEAHDLADQRRVAVKVLHADVAEDEVNIERFRREASTSGELDHAHIVDVFDFANVQQLPGRSGGGWYLAMEYLDGEELRALIKREKLIALPRIIRMVSQLALGLDPAHKRGLVHRDIKPDNVFLVRGRDGDRVKVLDFGSVKFTKGQDKGNKLTVLGTTIGSPYYMSPEQAQGAADLDHRADVWAIGVIVYEMTVGKVPFGGPNGPQILFKIIGNEALPPTMVKDDAAPELDEVLLKVLQKKPSNRYDSAGQFADALGNAFGLSGSHTDWAVTPEAKLAEALATSTPATVPPKNTPKYTPQNTPKNTPPGTPERASSRKTPESQATFRSGPKISRPEPQKEQPKGTPKGPLGAPGKPDVSNIDELPVKKLPAWAIPVGFVAGLILVGAVVTVVLR